MTMPGLAAAFVLAACLLVPAAGLRALRSNGPWLDPEPIPGEGQGEEKFYTGATVDHNNPFSGTWPQRYFINRVFHNTTDTRTPPVFLYIGGEGGLRNTSVGGSLFLHALAKQHGALVVSLEHRFYGQSWPEPDMQTETLHRLLTSKQALSDLGQFIDWFNADELGWTLDDGTLNQTDPSTNRPLWIAFGGSYPGNLAAWLKEKYPHLVRGSVASSAPVSAVVDFGAYMSVVSNALEFFGGKTCRTAVAEAVNAIHKALLSPIGGTGDGSRDELARLFPPCGGVLPSKGEGASKEEELDLATYELSIMGEIQGVVQYNLEGKTPPVVNITEDPTPPAPSFSHYNVTASCQVMLDGPHSRNVMHAFAQLVQMLLGRNRTDAEDFVGKAVMAAKAAADGHGSAPPVLETASGKCIEANFTEVVEELSNTTQAVGEESASRQWVYQTCREFGYFQTCAGASAEQQELSGRVETFAAFTEANLDWSFQICDKVYGMAKPPPVEATNTHYGGVDIVGNSILYPSGTIDPWHVLGITNSTSLRTLKGRSLFIEGTAHCADMRFNRPDEIENKQLHGQAQPELLFAQQVINATVAEWVAHPHASCEAPLDQWPLFWFILAGVLGILVGIALLACVQRFCCKPSSGDKDSSASDDAPDAMRAARAAGGSRSPTAYGQITDP